MEFYEVLLVQLSYLWFGNHVSRVVKVLLEENDVTLYNIHQTSKLSYAVCKYALIFLIKHALVEINYTTNHSSKPNLTYKLDKDKLFSILRYPFFLEIINKLFGPHEYVLFTILLTHGTISVNKLFELYYLHLTNNTFFFLYSTNALDISNTDLKSKLDKLIEADFINKILSYEKHTLKKHKIMSETTTNYNLCVNISYMSLLFLKETLRDFLLPKFATSAVEKIIITTIIDSIRIINEKVIAQPHSITEIIDKICKLNLNSSNTEILEVPSVTYLINTFTNLMSDSSGIWTEQSHNKEQCITLDTSSCFQYIQRFIIYKHLEKRYGNQCARIFEVLLDENNIIKNIMSSKVYQLGINEISNFFQYRRLWTDVELSEYSISPINITRLLLAKLVQADLVKAHLLDSSASETIQKKLYYYGSNMNIAKDYFKKFSYKCAINLLQRQCYEIECIEKLRYMTNQLSEEDIRQINGMQVFEDQLEFLILSTSKVLLFF